MKKIEDSTQKKPYLSPRIDVSYFEEDVIRTSVGLAWNSNWDDNWNSDWKNAVDS